MEIFISWSGQLSRELGEIFSNWIPGVLQFVKPYFTPDDMEKGLRWSSEIAKELQESQVGIIVLTRDNVSNQWIMFEAGALSKQMEKSKICPILFGMEKTDLVGPLVQFQATSFNKEDMKKLVKTINNECGDNKLRDRVLETVFEMWWPKLEEQINSVMEKERDEGSKELRSERALIEEILSLTRMSMVSKSRGFIGEDIGFSRAMEYLIRGYSRLREAIDSNDVVTAGELCRDIGKPIRYMYTEMLTQLELPKFLREMKVMEILPQVEEITVEKEEEGRQDTEKIKERKKRIKRSELGEEI